MNGFWYYFYRVYAIIGWCFLTYSIWIAFLGGTGRILLDFNIFNEMGIELIAITLITIFMFVYPFIKGGK